MKHFTHLVGIADFVAEIDALVSRGMLKPIWLRVVRQPGFQALVIKAMKDQTP